MANLSVEEPDALMHARPDLWEPWGVIPRATRPEASLDENKTVPFERLPEYDLGPERRKGHGSRPKPIASVHDSTKSRPGKDDDRPSLLDKRIRPWFTETAVADGQKSSEEEYG